MAKKSKFRVAILLVLVPVFLMYLHYSTISYHSHIFADGSSVTHSHPFKDCQKNASDKSKKGSEKQVIIFHGFVLVLSDKIPDNLYCESIPQQFIKIIFPDSSSYSSVFISEKSGRAPPLFHS